MSSLDILYPSWTVDRGSCAEYTLLFWDSSDIGSKSSVYPSGTVDRGSCSCSDRGSCAGYALVLGKILDLYFSRSLRMLRLDPRDYTPSLRLVLQR